MKTIYDNTILSTPINKTNSSNLHEKSQKTKY